MASNPLLTSVGSGTMVADGLNVVNDEVSSTSFRVSRAAIGPRTFIGNDVTYPAGGATGANCLLATKVMVPLDGKVREGVGLLGSPPFEVPRSVERDSRFDHMRTGEALRRGLAAKNRFNLQSIGIFLLTRWLGVFLITVIDLAAIEFFYGVLAHTIMAVLFTLTTRDAETFDDARIAVPLICGAMYPCSNVELVAAVSEAHPHDGRAEHRGRELRHACPRV